MVVMSLVPDITAGTGTESDETSVGGGSVGWRSRKEHRRGSFPSTVSFRGSDELGVGRRSIYTTATGRRNAVKILVRTAPWPFSDKPVYRPECRICSTSGWPTSGRNP